jgi:hypothetical protein
MATALMLCSLGQLPLWSIKQNKKTINGLKLGVGEKKKRSTDALFCSSNGPAVRPLGVDD